VNLIGDHTEHFGGLALPVAINMSTVLVFRPNQTDEVRLHSVYLGKTASFRLGELSPGPDSEWMDYVRGVADELRRTGVELKGIEGVVGGSLPVGDGLGSSSALAIAAALAFLHLAGREMPPVEIARLCHRAETEFLGLHSEIIKPVASLFGEKGMAIRLDCHTLAVERVPLPPADAHVVVCGSRVRGESALSHVLSRREQCREGARQIAKFVRGREIKSLRNVSLRDFNLYGPMLQPPVRQRVKHVVTENRRVEECAMSLAERNVVRAGVLLDASHASLRDDFEVSCKELDILVEIAWNTRQVIGARMTGLGFGGCAVALVEGSGVPNFCETVAREYKRRTELSPNLYVCQPERGAQLFTEDQVP
jgi:galactokinase